VLEDGIPQLRKSRLELCAFVTCSDIIFRRLDSAFSTP
jgi:hypothetical protein